MPGTSMSTLRKISPDLIKKNPDNPRLIFREDELDTLRNSIKAVDIQVPLTVYKDIEDDDKYIILDGERRWICARKLNLKVVPVIVQPRPSKLENILRMFNIHSVREQWDAMPSALKLNEVISLLEKEKGRRPTVKELASLTGLSASTVRRYFALLDLPQKYQRLIMRELRKPKKEQKFSEDFFLEMVKALNSVEKHVPEVYETITRKNAMENLVGKYKDNVITNIVKFRDVSRMARSENADVPREKAIPVIKKLLSKNKFTIEDAYDKSVQAAYEERTLVGQLDKLIPKISSLSKRQLTSEVVTKLNSLRKAINLALKK